MAVIARSDLRAILAAAAADPAREVCGLLLGEGDIVTRVRPARNVSPTPGTAFEIDPATLLATHRGARAGGPAPIGYYHSHPRGDPHPSPRDAAAALPDGRLWLIVGVGRAGLWRAVADGARHGRFDPVPWRLRTPQGLQDMPAIFSY